MLFCLSSKNVSGEKLEIEEEKETRGRKRSRKTINGKFHDMDTNEEDRSQDEEKYLNLIPIDKDYQAHSTNNKELETIHMTNNETHHITESTETKNEIEGNLQTKLPTFPKLIS